MSPTSAPDNKFLWELQYQIPKPQALGMRSLTFPYYYAQVVSVSVDPNRAGNVQARVSGVTDKWPDKFQPWFAPQLTTGMQQVPQKGHWLLVKFIDGDINQGMYYGVSTTKNFLPEEYVADYPDVAVLNMGETGYLYTHNRRSHISTTRNPGNNSEITWNAAGEVVLTSSNASDEPGIAPVSVLTEATIDIFTCKPVGSAENALRSGSEYLRVPHISKATIDVLRGNGGSTGTAVEGTKDAEIDGQPMKEIVGRDKTYEVPFMESPAAKARTGKVNKRVILSATGRTTPLSEALSNYTDDNAKNCAHYLVGLGDGDPDVLATLEDKLKANNLGFIQCADITYDCTLGSDMRGKPNLDAVSIVFYGNGVINSYQTEKMLDIINHVKQAGKLDEIEVIVYMPTNPFDPRFEAYTNLKTYEGVY